MKVRLDVLCHHIPLIIITINLSIFTMALFAQVLNRSAEPISIDIDDSNILHLKTACASASSTTLSLKSSKLSSFVNVVHLLGNTSTTLDLVLHSYDSPVLLKALNGDVHLVGYWEIAPSGSHIKHVDPTLITRKMENSAIVEQNVNGIYSAKSSDLHEKASSEAEDSLKGKSNSQPSLTDEQTSKKRKISASDSALGASAAHHEAAVVDSANATPTMKPVGTLRKKWRIKPQNEEGLLVPEVKTLIKPSGVTVTDFVVGLGPEPKLGSKVKIVYEGMYPDGKVFDSRLTRGKPLVFRKGTRQVIPGLDLGLEGMRIGGSREICIPSALG